MIMNITNTDIKVLGRIVAITTGVGNGDNGIVADASQIYDTVQKDNQENINKKLSNSINSFDSRIQEVEDLGQDLQDLISQIEGQLANYYTKSQTYNRTEIDNMIAGITIPDPLVVKTIVIKNNTTTRGTITTSGNSVEIDTEDGLTVKGNVAFTGDSFRTNDLEATNATIHNQLICDLGIASSKSGNVYRFTVDQDGNVKAQNIKVQEISNNHNNPNVPIFVNNPVALKSDLQFQVAQDEFRTISYNSSTGEVDFNLGAVHTDNNLTVGGNLTVEGDLTAPTFNGQVNSSNVNTENLHVTSSAVIDGPTTFQGVDGSPATISIVDSAANSGITSSYHFSQNSGQLNVQGLSQNENISFNNVNLDFTNANTEFEHVASNTSEFEYVEIHEQLTIPTSIPQSQQNAGDIYVDPVNNELRVRTNSGWYKVTLTPVQQ